MKRNPDECYNLTALAKVARLNKVKIFYVPEYSDSIKSKIGIHLLNPSERELEDAIESATRDMFPAIYIHQEF